MGNCGLKIKNKKETTLVGVVFLIGLGCLFNWNGELYGQSERLDGMSVKLYRGRWDAELLLPIFRLQ